MKRYFELIIAAFVIVLSGVCNASYTIRPDDNSACTTVECGKEGASCMVYVTIPAGQRWSFTKSGRPTWIPSLTVDDFAITDNSWMSSGGTADLPVVVRATVEENTDAFRQWEFPICDGNGMKVWSILFMQQGNVDPGYTEVANPVIVPTDGATFVGDSCTVSISCATAGAVIYYTTNGQTPRPSNRYKYTGPFTITDTAEICAFAVSGDMSSDYVTAMITKTAAPQLTLVEALDISSPVTTGGDSDWMPVADGSATSGSSARSGMIAPEESTWIETTVSGAGSLSFVWKADCEKGPRNRYSYDFGEFVVDGTVKSRIDGTTAWQTVTIEIAEGGTHVLRWTYNKDDYDEDDYVGNDCVWVDHVVWTPTDGLAAWLAERSLTADARAANGRTAAECYALGLDPTLATNDFRIVSIEMADGNPKVEWEPKTNRWTGAEIRAVLKGAESLAGPWAEVPAGGNPAFRFFKVVVELP